MNPTARATCLHCREVITRSNAGWFHADGGETCPRSNPPTYAEPATERS